MSKQISNISVLFWQKWKMCGTRSAINLQSTCQYKSYNMAKTAGTTRQKTALTVAIDTTKHDY